MKATSPSEAVKLLLLSAEILASDDGADREATFLNGLFKTPPPQCARIALTDEAALPLPLGGAEAAEAVDQVLAGSSVSAGLPCALVHIWVWGGNKPIRRRGRRLQVG